MTSSPWPMRVGPLLLRYAVEDDLDRLLALRNAPGTNRFMVHTHVRPGTFRRQWLAVPDSEDDFSCVAERDGQVVAMGFLEIEDGTGQPGMPRATQGLIGYIVDPAHAGRGVASDLARGLLAAAFDHLGLRRVTAACYADNGASARVLAKAGMRREQHGVQDSWHADLGWVDGCTYALLAHEWHAAHAAAGPVLREGERAAGPWSEVTVESVIALLERTEVPAGRPRVVAVDGRGGSGKTTLVERLARDAPFSAVVYTDDVAWHHSFFGWADLLVDGVLRPAHQGRAVHYRPPAWDQRGRAGAIEVPAATRWLFVEGTGAGRRELDGLLDAVVWVQSDHEEAERAGIARDVEHGANGDLEQATAFWHRWQAEEVPFVDEHRPWERADVVVAGVGLPRAGEGRVLIAPAPAGDLPHRL